MSVNKGNLIVVDFKDKSKKIKEPYSGTTGPLSACLGLGFYHPSSGSGNIIHDVPVPFTDFVQNIKNIIDETDFEHPLFEYEIHAAGLKYARPTDSELRVREKYKCFSSSRRIETQLPDLLDEKGFDVAKLDTRFNRQEGNLNEISRIDLISGPEGYCGIFVKPSGGNWVRIANSH